MHIVHLLHSQFGLLAERDIEEDLACILDIVVAQQRRIERILHSFTDTAFAGSVTVAHQGNATILHGCIDISEIQVDDTRQCDDLCDAFCCNRQRIIGFSESVHDGKFGIDLAKTFVVDDQQSIHVLRNFFNAIKCLQDFSFTFEDEWNGNDADSQYTHILSDACNDRSSTRSGTTAHSGSDEDHLRTVAQHVLDIIFALLSSHHSPFRLVACTESLRNFTSEHQFHGDIRTLKRLIVGIAKHERYIVYPFFVHVRHSIAAATTNSNHFNDFRSICRIIEIHYFVVHCFQVFS